MNPFLYGKPVTGAHFCNRKNELVRLTASVRSHNSIWLYSPRRYGKTSLVKESFTSAGKGIETAFIDLYGITGNEGFITAFLGGTSTLVNRLAGGYEKAMNTFRRVLTAVRPQLTVDDAGHPVFSLTSSLPSAEQEQVTAEVLSIPEKLAARRRRRVVIAYDEFQEITRISGLERVLRSIFQHQKWISYILAGSQRSLLSEMFDDPGRPFFQFADHMTLDRIPEDELLQFVRSRFRATGFKISDDFLQDIIAEAAGHPHFTQYFAAQAWDILNADPESADTLSNAWRERVVSSLDAAFRMFFDGLSTNQKKVLKFLSFHGTSSIFSEKMRRGHDLGSSSSVAGSLNALAGRNVLEKIGEGEYRFVNPAFRLWIQLGLRREL